MKLIKVEGDRGIVELSGIKKEISLSLLDNVKKGDYLIIHAGFAIQKLDEKEAKETLKIWEEIESIE
jgi:hydrogenase expression/formation protein HypC